MEKEREFEKFTPKLRIESNKKTQVTANENSSVKKIPIVPPLDLKFLNGKSEIGKSNNYIAKNFNTQGN